MCYFLNRMKETNEESNYTSDFEEESNSNFWNLI